MIQIGEVQLMRTAIRFLHSHLDVFKSLLYIAPLHRGGTSVLFGWMMDAGTVLGRHGQRRSHFGFLCLSRMLEHICMDHQ
jgi:hypothetical protein